MAEATYDPVRAMIAELERRRERLREASGEKNASLAL
jgi:hypothetical protein